ncbi:MAG: 1-acyl-sn-glycerol-3-phosphate acyltransferase [Deltaproteobacteria bacterium]|nr:1-acyl-sn-glycerol-3-phosphate acyltransferase [Deltaproteobacteria bacterium]
MKARNLFRTLALLPYQVYVIVVFSILLVLWGIGVLVLSLFDNNGNRTHRYFVIWAKTNLMVAGLRVSIRGLDRLDPNRTYVFMPNHASFLDILLAFAHIPYDFRMITKKELFSIPFMGWALKKSGQIPMNRKSPREGLASLRQADSVLKAGRSIVVFPEGTRTPDGKIQEFKPTLFILPIRANAPVVPVLIEGTFEALRKGSILLRPVSLRMTFYDPIPIGGFEDEDRWLYAKKVWEALASSGFSREAESGVRDDSTPAEGISGFNQ